MSRSSSKTRRAARAAGVTARSAQSSGIVKCYVERFENAVGAPDLRLREKSTKRLVRVLTDNQTELCAVLGNRPVLPQDRRMDDPVSRDIGISLWAVSSSPCSRTADLPVRGQLISLVVG